MDAYLADDRDTATAPAAADFLLKLAGGGLLSLASTAFLLSLMTASEPRSGLSRGLPAGTGLAQKAGAAPTDLGFTAVDSVWAVASLPRGPQIVIAGFQIGSTATSDARAKLFGEAAARITQAMRPA